MMNETCPQCHGRQLVYDEPCPVCHGSGHGVSDRTIQARIPAGVKDGQKIRLRARAPPARRAARPATCSWWSRSPAPGVPPQGRQPHPRRPGHLRRGGARRRDHGAHARRRPGDRSRSRPAPRAAASFRVRGRGAPNATAPRATSWSPCRCRCPASSTRPAPGGRRLPRRGNGARPAGRAVRRADGRAMTLPRRAPAARPDGPGLRDQRGRRAHRAAPADAAHLRPDRPGLAWAARAVAADATPCTTSSCCARSRS